MKRVFTPKEYRVSYNGGMLTMTYAYKLKPTPKQVLDIEDSLNVCRQVWNYALRERKDWCASRKSAVNACSIRGEYILSADEPFPDYHIQAKRLTEARKHIPELANAHSQILQQTLRQLDRAWDDMHKRGFGFPRFKKHHSMRSFVFPQLGKNSVDADGIKLPKIGKVGWYYSRPIPDEFIAKQARVVRKASGYFVLLTLQLNNVDIPDVPFHGHSIGVDVGLEYFLSTSDGVQVKRPRFFGELQRQLKLLQRRLKTKQRGSANEAKLRRKIARLHERIADTRKDWHFKLAHQMCTQGDSIFVEDLDFRIMAKGMLGKHTLDAGLGQFLNQILPWVCFRRGVFYGKVDAKGTSQQCPDCGARVSKDLSVRVHHCPECGSTKPRDIASAQVICTRGQRGIENVCGVDVTGILATESSQLAVKQKA